MFNIEWLLLLLLALAAGAQLVWGLSKPERHWQFPTLSAACWLFYMLPMAFGATRNPSKFPAGVLADHGLPISLLMCLLCVVATWFGWKEGLGSRGASALEAESQRFEIDLSGCHDRLLYYGLAVFLVGLWGAWKLSSLMGGFRAQFIEGANYETEWLGEPVKFSFFALLIYPGFLFSFRAYLERMNVFRTILLIVMALYPVAVAAFLGRRGATAAFLIILAVCIFFHYRKSLPPFTMALLCGLAGLAVLAAPGYRSVASSTGSVRQAVGEIHAKEVIAGTLSGENYGEFDALVVGCAFYNREALFDYGASLYNGLVNTLVPRQIVGEETKNRLLANLDSNNTRTPEAAYCWGLPYGSNPTGPMDAFKSFWYFGSMMYFGLSWWLGRIWRAGMAGSILHQLTYILFLPPAIATIYACWTIFPDALLRTVLLLSPVYLIYRASLLPSRRKNRAAFLRGRGVGLRERRRAHRVKSSEQRRTAAAHRAEINAFSVRR